MDLTIVMSAGFNVSRAAIAASSAGMASANSASHSSFSACADAACSLAMASSARTYTSGINIFLHKTKIPICTDNAISSD